MAATEAELDLREILLVTGLVQPVKVTQKYLTLSALCREVPGQYQAWLKVVETILRESAGTGIEFHLCRQFIWKDGQMVYGWHVSVEAPDEVQLSLHITWLRELLKDVQPDLTPAAVPEPAAAPQAAAPAPAAPHASQEDEELLEDEDEPQGPPSAELAARRADFRKHTNATPRMADIVPAGLPLPPQVKPQLRVVEKGMAKDQKNRMVPVIVEEFPLPHVFTDDMNKPNEKGRGATTLG